MQTFSGKAQELNHNNILMQYTLAFTVSMYSNNKCPLYCSLALVKYITILCYLRKYYISGKFMNRVRAFMKEKGALQSGQTRSFFLCCIKVSKISFLGYLQKIVTQILVQMQISKNKEEQMPNKSGINWYQQKLPLNKITLNLQHGIKVILVLKVQIFQCQQCHQNCN